MPASQEASQAVCAESHSGLFTLNRSVWLASKVRADSWSAFRSVSWRAVGTWMNGGAGSLSSPFSAMRLKKS